MRDFETYPYSKGYSLHLSDGNNWWITSDDESLWILERFAGIMKLEESQSNGLPKFVFFSPKNEDETKNNILHIGNSFSESENGWEFLNLNVSRIWYRNNNPGIVCEVRNKLNDTLLYLDMWNSLKAIFLRSFRMKGLPFHAGLAEYKGRGILLSADSGKGKSTCCRRLPEYWKPLCDDETLVVLDKNRGYVAHPFPTWSEYLRKKSENKWDVQYSVPLSAIFFLEKSEKDEVTPIPAKQSSIFITNSTVHAMQTLCSGMAYDERLKFIRDIFNSAYELATVIPVFRLNASLNGRFWEEIEKVLDL
jgi:SynChlorMet cassette protein ScmC